MTIVIISGTEGKMCRIIFYIFFLFILSSATTCAAEYPNRPFEWVDDEDYKPLIYRDEKGKPKGLFHDVLTEVFRRMNIPLHIQLYPWSRAQKMVEIGLGDGMVTVYTPTRQKNFLATDPVLVVHEHVFTNKNNPRRNEILNARTINDLKKFIIVDTEGSGWSKENLKGMKVIWVPTAESALNMVASKRADIYLLNDYTGPYFIKAQIQKGGPLQNKLKELVMGDYPITTMEYRLLIRKNSPFAGIISHFNAILDQMHKDGTYQKIIKRYQIDIRYHPDRKYS